VSLGERGGSTATLGDAQDLIDAQKAHWREAIRHDILETLELAGEWHADDLVALGVPADCKNVIGAAVGALVNQGLIEETGERRKSTAPESHGRKSNVYRLTTKGRMKLRPTNQVTAGESLGGPETASRGGRSITQASQCQDVASISGRAMADPPGGGVDTPSPSATALPSLFGDEDFVRPRSHYDEEAA
jgi:hypothetical protein